MIRWLVAAIGFCVVATPVFAADPLEIGIGYLGRAGVRAKLSLVEQPSGNDGVAGARLAIEDNNTTGKFLNQHFTLEEVRLKDGDDVAKAATDLAGRNGFIIADLPADELLKAADAVRERGTVLLNAGSIDDRLRETDCRANIAHLSSRWRCCVRASAAVARSGPGRPALHSPENRRFMSGGQHQDSEHVRGVL